MGKFNYRKYFGEIEPLADALREGENRCWNSRVPKDAGSHEFILYLGCNVLRTVNLAESIVAVLKSMHVDFVALGGPANCCGIVHHSYGDVQQAEAMIDTTLAKFSAIDPKAILVYCPSCHFRMDQAVPELATFDTPYIHVTEFLADNLQKLRFVNPIERRIGLHAHCESEQQQKDVDATSKILAAIPGLEVVVLPAKDKWGRHCTQLQADAIGAVEFNHMVDGMFAEAKKQGLDAIATVYHSCFREHCGKEAEHGIEFINYINLVTEGLGIPQFRDRYKEFKLAGQPAETYQSLRPNAEARNVDLDKLQSALQTHFGGSKS